MKDRLQEIREDELLANLPPEYPCDLAFQIEKELKSTPKEMVIFLEDDSTGVQKSHHVYLITDYSKEGIRLGIRAAKEAGHRLIFILTNSRALSSIQASMLNRNIARILVEIAREEKIRLRIGSRSDSTLRGHFPIEPLTLKKTLEKSLGIKYDGIIVSYAFITEMSRITVHGIHYLRVRKEDGFFWRSVHMTKFAKDSRFGYSTSTMAKYIEYKFASSELGKIKAEDIFHMDLDDIRRKGPIEVKKKLMEVSNGRFITTDIVTNSDLQVFVLGLLMAEREGKNFIYRTAASFPPARVNLKDIGILSAKQIFGMKRINRPKRNILCIWGSIIELSNQQLKAVLRQVKDIVAVPLSVKRVLESTEKMEKEITLAKERVEKALIDEKHALVYTVPRTEYPKAKLPDEKRTLLQQKIAYTLQEVYNRLQVHPDLVIFKGGTTSSVGLFGLGAKKVYVLGQVEKGIPIVKELSQDNEKFPGKEMFIILGPGNVGTQNTYVKIIKKLTKYN